MAKLYKELKDKELYLSFDHDETISIIIDTDLNIHYDLKNGTYKILIFNNANSNLVLKEDGQIINSNVEINVLELNQYEFKQDSNIDVYKGSSINVNTIYLGVNNKHIDYHLLNKENDSLIQISNNVVCLKDSDFVLNVVGKIVKGAKRSKCFQKSRCLTFENPKQAKILPVLEIDENDVEASHSLSSGTIDEDVLFYMNSRGLSSKDALKLLLESYLIPNEEFYDGYLEGSLIKESAYRKVENICSI